MADVITTIGTTGRNYSTVTAWYAATYGGATSADVGIGECYADSDFTGDNGLLMSSSTPQAARLRAATGQEHDGTANTGVRFYGDADSSNYFWDINATNTPIYVEDMEFDGADRDFDVMWENDEEMGVFRCLGHDFTSDSRIQAMQMDGGSGDECYMMDCIVYDMQGATEAAGLADIAALSAPVWMVNNTMWNLEHTGGSAGVWLNFIASQTGRVCYNNICMNSDGANYANTAAVTGTNNMASDTTAPGAGSLQSQVAANQFISTTDGSENLKLKAGANAIGAGADVTTTYTPAEIDILKRDRDAEGDTWCMGAHQYIAVAAGGVSYVVGGGIFVT